LRVLGLGGRQAGFGNAKVIFSPENCTLSP
jgi:hypothetical protein